MIAILLGVAFTGGYMVGRNSAEKRPVAVSTGTPEATAAPSSRETHSVSPASGAGASPETASTSRPTDARPAKSAAPEDAPLGSPKRKAVTPAAEDSTSGGYLPQSGQTFLQVAAVGRSESDAIADVLNKKGFHAHSVAKPGSASIYRVLIGPIRDTADLSSTREQLRSNGFRDVIVQRY